MVLVLDLALSPTFKSMFDYEFEYRSVPLIEKKKINGDKQTAKTHSSYLENGWSLDLLNCWIVDQTKHAIWP